MNNEDQFIGLIFDILQQLCIILCQGSDNVSSQTVEGISNKSLCLTLAECIYLFFLCKHSVKRHRIAALHIHMLGGVAIIAP